MPFQKITALFILSLFALPQTRAQIIGPDTVCLNTTASFSTPFTANSYAWVIGNSTLSAQTPGNATHLHAGITGASYPSCAIMRYEKGNYYGFVVNSKTGEINRLDFGANPKSLPTSTNLGNMNVINSGITECLDIVKDDTTWYGFVADANRVIRLDFGNSLTNIPTATVMVFTGYISWGTQVNVRKVGNKWIGFCCSYGNSAVIRLDFGTSLTNTPVPFSLPGYNLLNGPSYFCIYETGSAWHMFVTNLSDYKLLRYDFGANLMNNTPSCTDLGAVGGALDYPRGINIVEDCNGFYGVLMSQYDIVSKLDFQNNITNVPTLNYLGGLNTGTGVSLMSEYWYNDSLYFLAASVRSHSVLRIPAGGLPSGSSINYGPQAFTHTFTAKGVYDISVMCNEAGAFNGRVFCKQVLVSDSLSVGIGFSGTGLVATGGIGAWQWALDGTDIPGANSSTYIPVKSGKYTVRCMVNGGCTGVGSYVHFMAGIDDMGEGAVSMLVYPNPTTGLVNIKAEGLKSKTLTLSVFNIMGEKLREETINITGSAFAHTMDMSALPAGAYHLSVAGADGTVALKNIILQ